MPIPAPIDTNLRLPLSTLNSPSTPLGFRRSYSKTEGRLLSPLSASFPKADFGRTGGGFAIATITSWGPTPKQTPTAFAFDVETPAHGEYFPEEDKQFLLTRRPFEPIPLLPASPFENIARALDAVDDNAPIDFGSDEESVSSPDLTCRVRDDGSTYWVSSTGFWDLSDLQYEHFEIDSDSVSSLLFKPAHETLLNLQPSEADIPTLRTVLESQLPPALLGVLSNSELQYEVYSEKLSVIIFPDVTDAKDLEGMWLPTSNIFELSVTMAHSTNGYESFEDMQHQLQFISWLLDWIKANHNQTIEEVDISIPEDFVLPSKTLNATVGQKKSANSLLNLHTLSCSGNVHILSAIVASLDAKNVQVLKINSDISVDDAILLLRTYPGSKLSLHTLDLASISDCTPALLPMYEGKDGVDAEVLPPLTLPTLDSLKVVGSVDLIPLFDALSLPNLCKLELDVQIDVDEPTQALMSLPIVWANLHYLDVQFNGPIESAEMLGTVFKHQPPHTHILVNGESVVDFEQFDFPSSPAW